MCVLVFMFFSVRPLLWIFILGFGGFPKLRFKYSMSVCILNSEALCLS